MMNKKMTMSRRTNKKKTRSMKMIGGPVQCLRCQAWSVAAKQQLKHLPIIHQQMTFYKSEW